MTHVPMMLFTRPMWQFYLWDIHILTYPKFLMIKSVIQVFLIVLEKTVGKSDDIAHCIVYLLLILAYVLISVRNPPFNYKVLNFWHAVTLIAVVILALLNLLEMVTSERLLYVILLFSSWGVLAVCGYFVQRKFFTAFLQFDKNKNLDKLFNFGFRWQENFRSTIGFIF
jgi:hypothetical protein